MRTCRFVLTLVPLVALLSGCSVGGGLAGGSGDSSLYDVVPPVPSVPVALGHNVVRLTSITTNPTKQIDQYQALKDTITISLTSGPSSNLIQLAGEYLDPRANDAVYLRDKGGNVWSATSRGVQMTIITDATGAPQTYQIGLTSTSITGANILSQRNFSFGYPLPGSAPGLYEANVQTDDSPRPLNPGDDNYFVSCAPTASANGSTTSASTWSTTGSTSPTTACAGSSPSSTPRTARRTSRRRTSSTSRSTPAASAMRPTMRTGITSRPGATVAPSSA